MAYSFGNQFCSFSPSDFLPCSSGWGVGGGLQARPAGAINAHVPPGHDQAYYHSQGPGKHFGLMFPK